MQIMTLLKGNGYFWQRFSWDGAKPESCRQKKLSGKIAGKPRRCLEGKAVHHVDLLLLFDVLWCILMFLCGSVVEHCVSSARSCGFDSQGTHILMKMYNLNAIVSRFGQKTSAKCKCTCAALKILYLNDQPLKNCMQISRYAVITNY